MLRVLAGGGTFARARAGRAIAILCAWLIAVMAGFSLPAQAQTTGAAPAARTIVVVTDQNYPPYSYLNDRGEPEGYLIDLWALWSERTGIKVDLRALPWIEAQKRVLDGTADIIDTIFELDSRRDLYDFGEPYAKITVSLFTDVHLGALGELGAMRAFKIGVQAGDACIEHLRERGFDLFSEYRNYSSVIDAAVRQEVAAYCMDESSSDFYLYKRDANRDFTKAFDLYTAEMRFAVREGNVVLLKEVQAGMDMIDHDTLQSLRERWLGTPTDWTPLLRTIGWAAAVGSLVATIMAVWIFSLRRAVVAKTEELHRERASLQESEERFRCIFEDSRQPAALLENGRYFAANRATLDMFGMKSERQFIGLTPIDISPEVLPDGRLAKAEVPKIIARLKEEGTLAFEWVHMRIDGRLINTRVLLTNIRIGERNVLHVVWNDITGQKAAEAELEREKASLAASENRFRRLFSDTHLATLLLADGYFVDANPAAVKFLGMKDANELVGLRPRDVSPSALPDGRNVDIEIENVLAAATRDGVYEFEWIHQHADGHLIDTRVMMTQIMFGERVLFHVVWTDVSPEKRALRELEREKASLAESEERFRRLFEDTRQPTLLMENWRYTEANKAALDLLGLTREDELVGLSASDISPAAIDGVPCQVRVQQIIREATRDGACAFDWVHLHRSGRAIDVRVVLTPVRIAGREYHHVVWTDVSEEKAALARLIASEERFRRLFKESRQPSVLASVGDDGLRFIDTNKAALQMLGMSTPDELIGRNVLDITPPVMPDGEPAAERLKKVRQLSGSEGSTSFEWVHIRTDGTPIDLRVIVTDMQMDGRSIVHASWVDITAEKRAQVDERVMRKELEARVAARTAEMAELTEELRQASNEQQAIFDATQVGVIFVVERKVRRCNRAMEDLLGYRIEEMIGKSSRLFYPNDETFEAVGELIEETLNSTGALRQEVELRRKDGRIIPGRVTVQRVSEGSIEEGIVAILEDMTQEQATLRAMQRAKTMAEQAAAAKSDFMANMSHEIRTPMTGILGMTHLLLNDDSLSGGQRSQLEKIQGAGQHLLGILNDVLDFSKIEAGKMIIDNVDFVLGDVLDDVAAIVGGAASAKGLEFSLAVESDVPACLKGDPMRIAQVLTNYANNAVKFTDEGRVDIRVACAGTTDDGIMLRFSVRDTGPGLTEAQCARLFQSFEQVDSSITRKHGGTGLGLAISKQLAEHMGGEVGVDSIEGQGADFWFTVRVREGKKGASLRKGRATSRLTAPAGMGDVSVLLVEDNPLNQEVAQAMLAHFGVKSQLATNGATALQMVQQRQYDIVLMDMQMPVMDGLAATRAIRQIPTLQDLPIIAMTANAMASDRKKCLDAGMNDHLGKPIDPEELLGKIMKWTKSNDMTDANTPNPSTPAAGGDDTVLDIDAGLKRCMGREALYSRTLTSFLKHFAGGTEKIQTAFDAGDTSAMALAAHSLKGASGQVGAVKLQEAARVLEAAIHDEADETVLAQHLQSLDDAMRAAVTAIEHHVTVLNATSKS